MITVLYIHGFLSAPQSVKAQKTLRWFAEHHPDVEVHCPQLSSYPAEAKKMLLAFFESHRDENICVIGSSLGGFWATYLVEHQLASKAVLINPSVSPQLRLNEYIGRPLKSYYSEEVYVLSQSDFDELGRLDASTIRYPEKYWLMVQTGDETLDYRQAVAKYRQCQQLVEEGGNHSFVNYEQKLPDIANFFFSS